MVIGGVLGIAGLELTFGFDREFHEGASLSLLVGCVLLLLASICSARMTYFILQTTDSAAARVKFKADVPDPGAMTVTLFIPILGSVWVGRVMRGVPKALNEIARRLEQPERLPENLLASGYALGVLANLPFLGWIAGLLLGVLFPLRLARLYRFAEMIAERASGREVVAERLAGPGAHRMCCARKIADGASDAVLGRACWAL